MARSPLGVIEGGQSELRASSERIHAELRREDRDDQYQARNQQGPAGRGGDFFPRDGLGQTLLRFNHDNPDYGTGMK